MLASNKTVNKNKSVRLLCHTLCEVVLGKPIDKCADRNFTHIREAYLQNSRHRKIPSFSSQRVKQTLLKFQYVAQRFALFTAFLRCRCQRQGLFQTFAAAKVQQKNDICKFYVIFLCFFCKIEDRNGKISGYLLFPNDHLCLVRHGGERLVPVTSEDELGHYEALYLPLWLSFRLSLGGGSILSLQSQHAS